MVKTTGAGESYLEEIITHCKDKVESKKTEFTASDFETVNISSLLLDEIQKTQSIEAIYPANSLQQGFIYHALSQSEDDAYRVQVLFDYKQPLNVENYIKSWELGIKTYPILRTAFNWEEDLIQVVYTDAKLNCQFTDISDLSETEKEAYVVKLQEEDRKISFDLKTPCLLRLFIIKQSKEHYTILKSEHHSISDGWSGPILLNNIHQSYKDLQQKKEVKVRVQNSYLEAQEYFSKHSLEVVNYWKNQTLTIAQTNDLNPLLSEKQDLYNIKSLADTFDTTLEIEGDQYQQLKDLAKTSGITINTVLQFAWHKLI